MKVHARSKAPETAPETLAKVLTAEPDLDELPASTPPALRRLLRRCLERSPQNRLRDVGDARLVLAEIESGVADEWSPPSAATAADHARGRGRGREIVAWAAVVLALLAAGALYLSRPSSEGSPPRIIRSTLPLPEGVTIELDGTRAGMPALSPDGTRIAFGARQGRDSHRIWVQDLATSETRALPGTEEGYRPFWSPDGRKIGFFTWSNLSTTPSEGGPVTPLAPARDARGGTWSRDGTILFSAYSMGPLRVVPENGGEVELATHGVDGAVDTHRFPWFLPDSRQFLFLNRPSRPGSGDGAAIHVGRLGTTEPIARLMNGATNAVYSNGYLLSAKGGALVAQRFDPQSLEFSGEPSVLVDDLLVNRRFTYGVFSTSENGVLAFLTGLQRDLSRIVWRDRSGDELGQLGEPVNISGYAGLAISADSAWAAASIVDESTNRADIWLFDLRRGTQTRIGSTSEDDYDPIFSPDSSALYYASLEGRESRIVRRQLASGDEVTVFSVADLDLAPLSLSPDGASLVAAQRTRPADDSDLIELSLDTGETRSLLVGPEVSKMGQISPDGRWLAWTSDESGRYEIYVARYPTGENRIQVSRAGGVEPRWSPNGAELFYKVPDNWVTAVSIERVAGTLAVGEPERLFQVIEFDGWTYAVAPDGERFLTRDPLFEQNASRITLLTDWTALLER